MSDSTPKNAIEAIQKPKKGYNYNVDVSKPQNLEPHAREDLKRKEYFESLPPGEQRFYALDRLTGKRADPFEGQKQLNSMALEEMTPKEAEEYLIKEGYDADEISAMGNVDLVNLVKEHQQQKALQKLAQDNLLHADLDEEGIQRNKKLLEESEEPTEETKEILDKREGTEPTTIRDEFSEFKPGEASEESKEEKKEESKEGKKEGESDEGEKPKDPPKKKEVQSKLKSIWQAYNDGDISKDDATYYTIDAISKFARNMGQYAGNAASILAGGKADYSEGESSQWADRNAAINKQMTTSQEAGVQGSDKEIERKAQNTNIKGAELQNEAKDIQLQAARKFRDYANDETLPVEIRNFYTMLSSDLVDGPNGLAYIGSAASPIANEILQKIPNFSSLLASYGPTELFHYLQDNGYVDKAGQWIQDKVGKATK